jgi:hypothetical protein
MLAAVRSKLPEVGQGGTLNEAQALALLTALGVPCVTSVVIASENEPPSEIAYPVVAKILSRDVAHKTEAGGVALNITDAAALRAAAGRLIESVRAYKPSARIDGILIQPMERGLAEVLVGYQLDPHVGPTITLAMGGVLAEIYGDAAVRIAPVSEETAREMVDEVAGLALVRGCPWATSRRSLQPSRRCPAWRTCPRFPRPRSTRSSSGMRAPASSPWMGS